MAFVRIFIIIAILSVCLAPDPREPSDAPYIYYYADKLNAFIVERADGTETRVIGQGITKTSGEYHIEGAGWSPSGRWLAWTSRLLWYGHTRALHNYAEQIGTGKRLKTLDAYPDARYIWSPTQDILFGVSTYFEPDGEVTEGGEELGTNHLIFVAIDANTDTVIFSQAFSERGLLEYNLINPAAADVQMRWIDGQRVVVGYEWFPHKRDNDSDPILWFRMIDLGTGRSNAITLDYVATSQRFYGRMDGAISARGDVLTVESGKLAQYNIAAQTKRIIGNGEIYEHTIHWSPDGHYALLNGDKVELFNSETGVRQTLVEEGNLAEFFDHPYGEQSIWSPDSRYAVFVADQTLYQYDAHKQRLTVLSADLEYWRSDGRDIYWEWNSDSRVTISWLPFKYEVDHDARAIVRCDFADHRPCLDVSLYQDIEYGKPDISSDGRYTAYVQDGIYIEDEATSQWQSYRPPANSYSASAGGEVRFHPIQSWLFVFREGLVAGGAPCCRHYGIIRADGFYQRDLGFTLYDPSPVVLNWLPTHVPISELGSTVREPLYPVPNHIIKGNEWTGTLIWNPDSTQLLSAADYGGVYVADVDSAKMTRVFKDRYQKVPFWDADPASEAWIPALGNSQPSPPSTFDVMERSIGQHKVVWDVIEVQTQTAICTIDSQYRQIGQIIVSPDKRFGLLATPYEDAEVWDIQACKRVFRMATPTTGAAWSPDGRWLAVSSSWDIHLYSTDRFR
jgi:WD40 repeat protein